MPKTACYTLAWLPLHHTYELHESQGSGVLDIVPESSGWLAWLSQISSFAFHGRNGSYTARKERKQHGEGYWYAYARAGGKLTKRYLGRGIDLTLPRLERAAQELCLDPQAALRQFAPTHPSRYSVKQQGSSPDGQKVTPALSCLPTNPLLATKLHMPHPRQHLVHRPHLIQRLQQGLERGLTLLSASAGFGKSTLLADWLASCAVPVAWLSLESQDNEPTRFLSYLIAALQTYDPHLGTAVLPLLHPLHSPSLETVLTLLVNDLDRRLVDQHHVVLVLDDYQVITSAPVHYALSFLLDHLPSQMHLVLATREDPPLPLARLRGRDALVELRTADLQFTQEETATYLVEVMGLPLSTEESALLHARTEGWITGLHLAALSLLGHENQAGFITAFSGSHHYIMDYLLQEVLSRQPPGIQDFLLQTCILDQLSASLCDAVCTTGGSQTQLDFLEQANLFLIPLDDERRWYRYHRLFAEVLRQRLQQTAPKLVPDLHRRASRWYEQHECFAEAVSHALATSASEEAVRLIEQCAERFISGRQVQTLCGWLHALPESLMLAHSALCLMHAMALMYTNRWEAASACLQVVERGVGLGEDMQEGQGLLGQVVACRSLLALFVGDLEGCVTLAQRALDLLPETEMTPLMRMSRVVALLGAAHAYLVSGDVTMASERLLTQTALFARASSDYQLLTFRVLTLLARLRRLQGRLHQAAVTYEEAKQVVSGPEELQALPNSPAYSFGLGDLLREWNELDAAEHQLAQGMDLMEGTLSVEADEIWLGYAALARLQHAQGRDHQALATLDIFLQIAQQRHIASILVDQCAALRAQMELARGDLPAARHWVATSGLSANDVPCYLREREYLTLARVCIAEERVGSTSCGLSDVLILLERLLAGAEANGRMQSVLEVLLVRAMALEVQGDYMAAMAALACALVLAEPEGYVRLFLDEGPPMVALLQRAQRRGLAPRYIAKLLEAVGELGRTDIHLHPPQSVGTGVERSGARELASARLVEPLTPRERDVLRLVLDGASNREIACQLILSVNTVKKHILNSYGKLNVRSRTQAIAKAQVLHLL